MRALVFALAVGACTGAASARPVFFDDFDGNALLPHWETPPASHWGYNVSNSMLNVTGLFYPSVPKLGANHATIGAAYAPQTDFRADIWMGWDPGEAPQRLMFRVATAQGGILAFFTYSNTGPVAQIEAGASNQLAIGPPPPSGVIHQFTIERTGSQFGFSLNGSHFATIQALSSTPASIVSIEFLGPYPGTLGALHVDRVVVIPGPGGIVLPVGLALCAVGRRRR